MSSATYVKLLKVLDKVTGKKAGHTSLRTSDDSTMDRMSSNPESLEIGSVEIQPVIYMRPETWPSNPQISVRMIQFTLLPGRSGDASNRSRSHVSRCILLIRRDNVPSQP